MRSRITALILICALGLSAALWAGNKKKQAAASQMDERRQALHALHRLTFGPRPGDVERVMSLGVDKWIEQQLHPEKLDDRALEARLEPFRTLRMDTRALLENFPPPPVIKAVANGRLAMPSDPAKRAIYEAQLQRMQDRQEKKQEQPANAQDTGDQPGMMLTDEQRAARRQERMEARAQAQQILDLPPDQRVQAVFALDPESRQKFAQALRPEEREQFMASLTPQQREQVMALANPQRVITEELMEGKLLRAAYSERQLQEVLTDFWFNHFNVFIGKGPDRYLIAQYERDVIRPHALGKFKDLLVATAQSPAMLFYLDNWQSVGPDSPVATGQPAPRPNANQRPMRRFGRRYPGMGYPPPQRPQPPPKPNAQRRGLNENYARELMELHTLGVDGGYTQRDVTEVARVFTGWTIRQPKQGGGFEFNERMHEPGAKFVLGHSIKENGEKEGMEVLEILARHPSTARFISRELAMRFVSDDPPPALVSRMAETFLKSDGDIREVLRTMFRSPEFWSPQAYRAKVKTPLEFVASAVRASGADVSNALPLIQALNQMGMPLYGAQPPTGYSLKNEAWVNSAALLARLNFALKFASGRMPGVQFDPQRVLGQASLPGDPDQALGMLENALLAGDLSKQTHDSIRKHFSDPEVSGRVLDDPARSVNVAVITGLLLGSPEFQRR